MDRDMIRAYLWQDIIRLGFSPSGPKEQASWLHQYGRSLKEFWGVESPAKPPARNAKGISATIDSSIHIGLSYEYFIENNQKFTVRLMHAPPIQDHSLLWLHDMDGKYFSFPNQILLTKINQRNPALQQMTTDDIGHVIDALIVHPTPHQHIESPLDHHDIRIGGAITNPYLYLFHLRVQLCPDNELRMAERSRLISLFETAIRQNQQLTANELMETP